LINDIVFPSLSGEISKVALEISIPMVSSVIFVISMLVLGNFVPALYPFRPLAKVMIPTHVYGPRKPGLPIQPPPPILFGTVVALFHTKAGIFIRQGFFGTVPNGGCADKAMVQNSCFNSGYTP
jgi:hypothetical protein